eukprot:1841158-Rhodomonas_salina.1
MTSCSKLRLYTSSVTRHNTRAWSSDSTLAQRLNTTLVPELRLDTSSVTQHDTQCLTLDTQH